MPPEENEVRKPTPEEEPSAGNEQPAPSGGRPALSRLIFPVIIGLLAVAVIALFAKTRSQSGRLDEEAGARKVAEELTADLERDLADQLRELNDVSDQLRFAEAGRSQLQAEVVELRASRIQLESRVESLQSQNTSLDERLRAEQAALSELRESFRESREAQKRYLDQIEKLLEDKNELQNRLAAGRTVEMPGLLVKDGREAIPSFRGTILKVNPDYNFVVINRGSSDGVVSGARFKVLDGDREIGEVTATRILPDMTVADINTTQTYRQLRTGFTVLVNE
jgi:vacuolar-type H+-ATPase subunit I/STV1